MMLSITGQQSTTIFSMRLFAYTEMEEAKNDNQNNGINSDNGESPVNS